VDVEDCSLGLEALVQCKKVSERNSSKVHTYLTDTYAKVHSRIHSAELCITCTGTHITRLTNLIIVNCITTPEGVHTCSVQLKHDNRARELSGFNLCW
jgi:hypothetical protein